MSAVERDDKLQDHDRKGRKAHQHELDRVSQILSLEHDQPDHHQREDGRVKDLDKAGLGEAGQDQEKSCGDGLSDGDVRLELFFPHPNDHGGDQLSSRSTADIQTPAASPSHRLP